MYLQVDTNHLFNLTIEQIVYVLVLKYLNNALSYNNILEHFI